jgi:hypothetical protein
MLALAITLVLVLFVPLSLLPLALSNFFSADELSDMGVRMGRSRP